MTDFHDKIIDACCAATESHIPYGGKLRQKLFQVGTLEWIKILKMILKRLGL